MVRIARDEGVLRIIEQALDGLPEGPYITENRKYALPPRHELATLMEALIHHFKLVTEGFRVPPGEVYYPIESPRGELGCFVRSDGSSKPARVHMRDPSFVNLQALPADGPRTSTSPTSSRRSGCSTRCSGDRPLMAASTRPRSAATSTARRVPGWDDAADLTKDPAIVPDPATTPVPDELRAEIEALHGAATRTSARPRSPRCTPRSELHGWCSPTAIEQVACVMRLTPGYLTAVATFYDMFETRPEGPARRLRVHEHLVLAARRRRALRGDAATPPATTRDFNVRGVRVPRRVRHRADGVRQRRVRRPARRRTTAEQIVDDVKAGRPVLEAKQLRSAARPPARTAARIEA